MIGETIEKKVARCAEFDDIAPIAVYLQADLKYSKQTRKSLSSLKKHCKELEPVQNLQFKDLEDCPISFWDVYNLKFREILDEYGLDTSVDKWGALCYIDKQGVKHCGDGHSEFPWYMGEESLREDIEDFNKHRY